MTIDHKALLTDLQRQVRLLEDDVRDRAAANPELTARLEREHAERVGSVARPPRSASSATARSPRRRWPGCWPRSSSGSARTTD